jgi:hypothetical protein
MAAKIAGFAGYREQSNNTKTRGSEPAREKALNAGENN